VEELKWEKLKIKRKIIRAKGDGDFRYYIAPSPVLGGKMLYIKFIATDNKKCTRIHAIGVNIKEAKQHAEVHRMKAREGKFDRERVSK
jgi:hypothetical protein